jgi:two-component system, OmpR family, phosphate regulon sensor histidine kinase PhoR
MIQGPKRNTPLIVWAVVLLIAVLLVVGLVLEIAASDATSTATLRQGLLLGLGLLALGSAVFALRVTRRDAALQEQAIHAAESEARRLETIINTLPVGVRIVSAPDGEIVLQNPAAEVLSPAGAWSSRKPEERPAAAGFFRADGTPLRADELPSTRTLREGIALRDFEMTVARPDLGTKNLLVSTAPLRDDQGRITAAVIVVQDVTHMKELDRRKDEFIATAAHELRNPLAVIFGYNQLLQKMIAGADTHPKAMIYVSAMGKQLARLNALVERLLDASRIQLGRLVLEKTSVNLVEVTRAVAANAETANETPHTIEVKAPPEGIRGEWDLVRIEQVLTNLVSNAARYSPPETNIEVRIERRDGVARVEVIDQGPGVPAGERAGLFERYSQGGGDGAAPTGPFRSLTLPPQKRGALGLGLYISSEIIKAHGGQIGMDPNPSGGSIFWFTLPL